MAKTSGLMATKKVYIMTEKQMDTINHLLCAVAKTCKEPHNLKALKKTLNELGQMPCLKSSDSIDKVIRTLKSLKTN